MAEKERGKEGVKVRAAELAGRVRFLREEIKEGRGAPIPSSDRRVELREAIKELTSICPADSSVKRIVYKIYDSYEKRNGGVGRLAEGRCLREVEVDNPLRSETASDTQEVSLLPPWLTGNNLDVLKSDILPDAFGGM